MKKIKMFLVALVVMLGLQGAVASAGGVSGPELWVDGVFSAGVRLAWQSPAGNEAGFAVERGTDGVYFSPIAYGLEGKQYNPKTYYFIDSYVSNYGLERGGEYYYRVRAFKKSKSGTQFSSYSNVVSAKTF